MMKNNSLDELVRVDIELANPATGQETFDSICMIVPPPEGGAATITSATAISSASELLDYGFATTDTAYVAATVLFSQSVSPRDVYVLIRTKTEEENPLGPDEPKITVWEDMKECLERANTDCGFYGVHITDFRDEADIQATIEWVEANYKLFVFEYLDIAQFPVQNTNYFRTAAMFSGLADGYEPEVENQPGVNKYAALAWMGKAFTNDPGSETWHLIELATIVPSVISTAQKKSLDNEGISSFRRYSGKNVTFGGKTLAGEWIDVIRFRDWVRAKIQLNGFNALLRNKKIPYTDEGITLLKSCVMDALQTGQNVGGIAPTMYNADGDAIPGYTIKVPLAVEVPDTDKQARVLRGIEWTARLAGAIHVVEIKGLLSV